MIFAVMQGARGEGAEEEEFIQNLMAGDSKRDGDILKRNSQEGPCQPSTPDACAQGAPHAHTLLYAQPKARGAGFRIGLRGLGSFGHGE